MQEGGCHFQRAVWQACSGVCKHTHTKYGIQWTLLADGVDLSVLHRIAGKEQAKSVYVRPMSLSDTMSYFLTIAEV